MARVVNEDLYNCYNWGALIGKSIDVVKALLEEMASNNYHRSNEGAIPRRASGKYDIDAVTLLTSGVDALAQSLDRVGASPLPGSSSGLSVGVYAICKTCTVQRRTCVECYNGPSTIEHTNALKGFHSPPQHTFHSTIPKSPL